MQKSCASAVEMECLSSYPLWHPDRWSQISLLMTGMTVQYAAHVLSPKTVPLSLGFAFHAVPKRCEKSFSISPSTLQSGIAYRLSPHIDG